MSARAVRLTEKFGSSGTFFSTEKLVPGHFADERFAERTFCRKDNLPKIEMVFRQNVWDCDSFLNCVILNNCEK
jgi:hypothetical protein